MSLTDHFECSQIRRLIYRSYSWSSDEGYRDDATKRRNLVRSNITPFARRARVLRAISNYLPSFAKYQTKTMKKKVDISTEHQHVANSHKFSLLSKQPIVTT